MCWVNELKDVHNDTFEHDNDVKTLPRCVELGWQGLETKVVLIWRNADCN